MRHTPEVNGASSPPLLYAGCACPLETGLFPVHARCCPRGSRKGASSTEDRTRETADGPGYRAVPLEAPRAQRRTKPPIEAAALAPQTQGGARAATGLRPLPGPILPEHCPSFTTRAARRGHQIPCLFWTLNPLWTLLFYISVQ